VADVVLGIETSCDETSAAVLVGDRQRPELAGLVILSQDVHKVFGGVVPELASRAHLTVLPAVVDRALAEAGLAWSAVDAVAVTQGPGLVGALLVGVVYAKALAYAGDRALIGVHHMEGHLFAPAVEDPDLTPPFVALLVSGGHTLLLDVLAWGRYRLLGATRDDAAGEAFDKVATLLGLGYPGGPAIERLATQGDPTRFTFPRPMRDDGYEFSFSGLKTAVLRSVRASTDLDRPCGPARTSTETGRTSRAVSRTRCSTSSSRSSSARFGPPGIALPSWAGGWRAAARSPTSPPSASGGSPGWRSPARG